MGAATDLPLFVYNLPQATGVEITVELMTALQNEVPQLVGVKHSAFDFNNIYLFSLMGIKVFTGNGRLMLPALTVGAAGCVDGPPCLAPELWVEVWEAYTARDLDRAEAAQSRANEIMDVVVSLGYFGALKAAVGARLGIETGDPRLPNLPATPDQKAGVVEALHRLGLMDKVA